MTGAEAQTARSRAEFAAWVTAERPDWESLAVSQLLVAADTSGWGWDRTVREVVKLVFSPDGHPWELRREIADAQRTVSRPADPETRAAAIAELKAACEAADAKAAAAADERGAS